MSKFIKLRTYRIAVVVCALCGGLIGYWVGSDISSQDAYELGKIDGEIRVYKLWNEQLEEIVEALRARGLLLYDSTDTMPVVEDDVDWDTIPFNEPILDVMYQYMPSCSCWVLYDFIERIPGMPIILPDTGGVR